MMQANASTANIREHFVELPPLEQVIEYSPLTIAPDILVSEAINLMGQVRGSNCQLPDSDVSNFNRETEQQSSCCALVVAEQQLQGIITETDVVKLTAEGINLSQVTVAEVMTTEVITLTQSHTQNALAALALMRQHRIRHLPILDEHGQLLGIVTFNSIHQVLQLDTIEMAVIIAALQQQVEAKITELRQVNQQLQQEVTERQKIEEALRQNQQQLQAIFNQTFEFIGLLTPDGIVLEVNQTAIDFIGVEKQDVIGLPLWETPWWAGCESSQAALQAAIAQAATGKFVRCDVIHHNVIGIPTTFDFSLKPLRDETGRVVFLIPEGREINARKQQEVRLQAASKELERRVNKRTAELAQANALLQQEITERQQTEEALRESNERLMLALESAKMGTWDWNIAKGEILWTPQHEVIFGDKPGTPKRTYTDWSNRVHPEDLPLVEARLQAAIANQHDYQCEYRIVHPDNSIRTVASFGRCYYDISAQPIRMLGTLYDITHQKLAEKKIHEQAALLNIITDTICVRDLEQRIIFWNHGAENLYGFSADEAVSKNAKELLYKDTSQVDVAIKTVVESGFWQGELTIVGKDGREVIVSSRWTLMRDEAGQPKSILTVNTDITEKKQLEAQFYRAQRLESLGTLASGIAHDLNNILTPILTVSQLLPLKLKNIDERCAELLKMQEASAKRGADLVKQILSFARGAEGKRTCIQIQHLLLDIQRIARGTFPKSIAVEHYIPDNLATVIADATQIHQVLMNLIVNARDAMPNGGTLSISAENFYIDENYAQMDIEAKVGFYVVITIADTGVGITPEIIERIFDPFFTTKDANKGTGLGLSTVIGIIKNHRGFVNVSSEVGKGSQFQVYLPAKDSETCQITKEQELPQGQGELILVVDDEAIVAATIQSTLLNHNYKVLIASDGIEAIALYTQHHKEISFVLIDMMMPLMEGENTIRILQKINPKIKIIAMSGLTSTQMIEKATRTGVKQFLPKPFTAQELLHCLHEN
jgi:PAS domain S-box-containing protein